ncbi:MAG: flagellar basal body L-ring protein FlgH [Gemmatimonadota bacterium]|nr:flagellar basal body L-ring protein FlgH [Gemmatimonadota bacterium]
MRHLLSITLCFTVAAPSALAQAAKKGAAPAPPVDSVAPQYTGRQSWTSDRYRLGVGDIVTVLVNDQTLASASTNNSATDIRAKELDFSIKPPDSPTKAATAIAATAGFNNNGDSKQTGEATRNNIFQSTLSARVIAVSPTGMLQIRGRKMVNVDRNQQEVTLTGWVRPQDIDIGSNMVESTRVADADIIVSQKGKLGKPKSGILSKIVGMVWP